MNEAKTLSAERGADSGAAHGSASMDEIIMARTLASQEFQNLGDAACSVQLRLGLQRGCVGGSAEDRRNVFRALTKIADMATKMAEKYDDIGMKPNVKLCQDARRSA